MKKIFLVCLVSTFLLVLFNLFFNCAKKNVDPVGPSISTSLKEGGEGVITLDDYEIIRTNWHLSFNGVGNIEGFDPWAGYCSDLAGGYACTFTSTNDSLVMWWIDMDCDCDGWVWGSWLKNETGKDLIGSLGDNEIPAFLMRARSSNDNIKFSPRRIAIKFTGTTTVTFHPSITTTNTVTNLCGVSTSIDTDDRDEITKSCSYSLPEPIPSHWTSILILSGQFTPENGTTEECLREVNAFSFEGEALSIGQSGAIFIDDITFLILKPK